MKSLTLLFACAFCAISINATTIHVPANQPGGESDLVAATNPFRDLNLEDAHAMHAPDYQTFPVFYSGWDSDDSVQCMDSSHALHPSVQYISEELWGYKFWMAYTPYCVSESDENPHLAVSNDGENWQEFASSNDTLPNPLFDLSDFNATHMSDPDLFFDLDGGLWIAFRVSWEIAGKDSHAVYIARTSNGTDWNDPTKILSDGMLAQTNASAFMSPSIIVATDSSYSMFVVEPRANGTTYLNTSRVVKYTALKPDGSWSFVDTCNFPPSHDSMKIWHLEVVKRGAGELVALVTESPNAGLNFGDSAELYVAVSGDGGYSWTSKTGPILSWSDDVTAWYGRAVYRSTGYWIDDSERGIMGLYYSALARQTIQGGTGTGWQTGFTHLFFDTTTDPVVYAVLIDGKDNAQHVINHSPEIDWLYLDPTGEYPQTQFEVAVGTDSDWAYAEMWVPVPFPGSDTYVIYAGAPLIDGETYYLRLRVNNGTVWSDWYETSFRMNSVPSIPLPLSPINDEYTGTTPLLWIQNSTDAEGDTLTYDFFCDVDTTYGEPDPIIGYGIPEGTDSTGWQVTEVLHENWRYTWVARAFDGYEYSDWTDGYEYTFFVNATPEPPTAPQAQYPPDTSGLPVFDMLTTFLWSASFDPDPMDTVYYTLEIATDSTFNFVYTVDSLDSPPFTLTDSLTFGTHYWWRVTAFDNTGLPAMSPNTPDFWTWRLGDVDHSHAVNIADLVFLVDFLFHGCIPPWPLFVADINGDCSVNVVDLTYLVEYLFFNGHPPKVGCAAGDSSNGQLKGKE